MIGDLDADDAGVGGHADEVVLGGQRRVSGHRVVTPGDDPGHVGAVTECVEVAVGVGLGFE